MAVMAEPQLEEVTMALLLAYKEGLAESLDSVADEMVAKDADWAVRLGETLPDAPLVMPVIWQPSFEPSLMEKQEGEYPFFTCAAYDHSAATIDNLIDQIEVVRVPAWVEIGVYAEDIRVVSRLAERYLKAAVRTILLNPTLDHVVEGLRQTPHAQVSNPAARKKARDSASVVYVQLARVDFEFRLPELW